MLVVLLYLLRLRLWSLGLLLLICLSSSSRLAFIIHVNTLCCLAIIPQNMKPPLN